MCSIFSFKTRLRAWMALSAFSSALRPMIVSVGISARSYSPKQIR